MQTAMNDLLVELNEQDGATVQGGWDFGFAVPGWKNLAAEYLSQSYKTGKPATQKALLDYYIGEKGWLDDYDGTEIGVGKENIKFGSFNLNWAA
jgi:hypothetical protein